MGFEQPWRRSHWELSAQLMDYGIGVESYRAPSARISATEILVLGFISKSQTREIGRRARVQSAHTLRALCVYVDPDTVLSLTHDPV
jgi:hypothetical protein